MLQGVVGEGDGALPKLNSLYGLTAVLKMILAGEEAKTLFCRSPLKLCHL